MNLRIKKLKEILKESVVFKSIKKYKHVPRTQEEYVKALQKEAYKHNNDLNVIDVSYLQSVYGIEKFLFFRRNNFYVDEWNVSNVKSFFRCFAFCPKFDCDLKNWDVSNGEQFEQMFLNCYNFNQPINHFNLSNSKESFWSFLKNCKEFNQELYNFKFPRSVYDFRNFFDGAESFNQDISMWDVSNITKFSHTFQFTKSFEQDLSKWDVSNAEIWVDVFKGSLMNFYPELMPPKFRKWRYRFFDKK